MGITVQFYFKKKWFVLFPLQDLKLLMEEKVAEHKSTIDYNEPRDYIDKVQHRVIRNIREN